MRKLIILSFLLASSAAYAQRTAVPSDHAGNILNGSPELANQLPTPQASSDTVDGLLAAADSALQAGHTGEAQEGLEEAETRALDRSVPYNDNDKPATDPVVTSISQALQALGMKDIAGAHRAIDAARAADKSS